MRRGKRGWCSMRGPSVATGARSTSSTTCTACGLPIDSAEIDVSARGILDHQHLVAADAEAPVGERADLEGAQREWLARGVDHDEVVAEAVHLGERERGHGRTGGATCPRRTNGKARPSASVNEPAIAYPSGLPLPSARPRPVRATAASPTAES